MAIGTRDIANIRFGIADVYMGSAESLDLQANFGDEIEQSILDTHIAAFENLGELGKGTMITSKSNTVDLIYLDMVAKVHNQHTVRAEIECVEVDNDIVNDLMTAAEAKTRKDFFWLRENAIDEYVNYLRNVPFTVEVEKEHSFEKIERIRIIVEVIVGNIYDAFGQLKITSG